MAKEVKTPAVKAVPASGGFKQPSSHTTLTTPNQEGSRFWSDGKDAKQSILGRK